MNPYQSTLYQLTESVGAVSMVSIEQIKKEENLDYLQHLCTFIDRMNINPIWFENEDNNNKAKILSIYQLAITYSNNLSNQYQRTIQQKEAEIRVLRQTEREKTRQIRDHKDEYQSLKERYKLKKHQMYKFMYDNLRHKLKEEDQFRETRRDPRDRSELPPEIVYYYPQPNDLAFHGYPPYPPHVPYDPHMPPQQYDPRMWAPPPPPHQPAYPNYPDNIQQPPLSNPYLQTNPSVPPGPPTLDPDSNYKHFLNSGNYRQADDKDKPQMVLTNSKIISPKNNKLDSPKSDLMEKSNIIASGEKLYEKLDKQIKEKSEKSISRESGVKKKESVRLEQDDDFGDLTVNSKKKDNSIKLSKKDSGYEQEQFDSIAHIKLGTQSSNKNIGMAPSANKRFQSKIYGKEERRINTALPSSETAQNQASPSTNENVNSVMQSNYSRNSGQPQGQRLFEGPNRPKRASQSNNNKVDAGQEGKPEQMKKSNQGGKNTPKGAINPSPPKAPQTPTEKGDKSIDIYKSNVGRAQSNKLDIPKGGDPIDIYSSNMGHGSNNSKNSQAERLFSNNSRPKRVSQSPSPSPSPAPSPSSHLEVPEVKKSNIGNQLRISVAESQQMKGSNMLYSQANSMHFTKQQGKTPPKLEKPAADEEDEVYEDDFDIDDIEQLEKSHLPISQNKPTPKLPEKSEVNIDISSIPTVKEIVKDKYAKLPNETFELKNNPTNLVPPKIAASSTLSQSDNFFDEILQMPMNSRIAKRPTLHKFDSSAVLPKSVDSLKKGVDSEKIDQKETIREAEGESSGVQSVHSLKKMLDSGQINNSSGGAVSPSIRVIDPAGHMERLQSRGGQQGQAKVQTEGGTLVPALSSDRGRLKSSSNSNMAQFNTDSITLAGKQTSLLDVNLVQREKADASNSQDDEQIDFDIMQESSIKPNTRPSSKQQNKDKFLAAVAKIESQPPAYNDPRGFDQGWFDRILKEQFKTRVNQIRSAQKWEDIEVFYRRQCERLNELQSRPLQRMKEERSENASTPKSIQRESNYDDLQYSQSNAKFDNKSLNKGDMKKQSSFDPVKEMTQSITIKDPPKIEEKPKTVQNKYSRSGKAKVQVKGDLTKNLKAGKNAYDVDDPLNVAAYQNKRLLEEQEESQSDF